MCGLATILVFQGVPSCWRTSLRSNSWSLRIRRRCYRRRRSKTASSVAHSVEVADQPHNLEVRSRLLFCQISRVGKLFRNLNKFSVWMFGQSQIECINIITVSKHLHVVSSWINRKTTNMESSKAKRFEPNLLCEKYQDRPCQKRASKAQKNWI